MALRFAPTLLPLVLVASTSSCQMASQDPKPATETPASKTVYDAKETKIRELLALTGHGQMGKLAMDHMMQEFESMPNLPKDFTAKFKEMAKPDELVDRIVQIYVTHVETDDLDELLAFHRSPAGKRWIRAQAPINKEIIKVGQKWSTDLNKKVIEQVEANK